MSALPMAPELFRAELNWRERCLLRAMGRRTCVLSVEEAAHELGVTITTAEELLRNLTASGLVKWDYRLPVRHAGWTLGIVGAHVARCVEREDQTAVADDNERLAIELSRQIKGREPRSRVEAVNTCEQEGAM